MLLMCGDWAVPPGNLKHHTMHNVRERLVRHILVTDLSQNLSWYQEEAGRWFRRE